MTGPVVRVTAPSRLHFGMLSIHRADGRHYGGAGAMVASPGLRLLLRPADRLAVSGPLAARAYRVARRVGEAMLGPDVEPPCRIEVLDAPPEHVGLGTGTQLSMAVAAGLNKLLGGSPLDAASLARLAGRGERSAIGLYGFALGGLLFEAGKRGDEEIAPLVARPPLPEAWRFVLIRPQEMEGLSGELERRAFAQLPPVPDQRAAALCREATEHLLPAAAAGRFDEFSESLYRFGYTAGLSFASQQGGPFAGPRLAALVELIRDLGVRGAGQSSWGPTLFALLPDPTVAADFVGRFRRRTEGQDLELTISPPDNCGAKIEVE